MKRDKWYLIILGLITAITDCSLLTSKGGLTNSQIQPANKLKAGKADVLISSPTLVSREKKRTIADDSNLANGKITKSEEFQNNQVSNLEVKFTTPTQKTTSVLTEDILSTPQQTKTFITDISPSTSPLAITDVISGETFDKVSPKNHIVRNDNYLTGIQKIDEESKEDTGSEEIIKDSESNQVTKKTCSCIERDEAKSTTKGIVYIAS